MINDLNDAFFEALGEPKPGTPFDLLDAYRFQTCLKQLAPGSVLDVGAYLGDFLKLVIADGRKYYGSEVNQARVNLVNSILGSEHVRLGFRNGDLSAFEDDFVDNVVCMETIEHVSDDARAVAELCRVARKRIVITVPFREHIQSTLCIHCNHLTPHHGHQHRYDHGSFEKLVVPGWKVTKEVSFAKRPTLSLSRLLPNLAMSIPALKMMDGVIPAQGKWLLVVLEAVE
jgi:SAM-dependent methyltransferase